MIAIFTRTYLVVGPEAEPQVVMIDARTHEFYLARMLGTKSRRPDPLGAVRATFGAQFDTAFAAWHEKLVTVLATTYEGPFQALVRALAAAIALGMPFEELYTSRKGGSGGEKVTQPRVPVRPQPGGAAVALPV